MSLLRRARAPVRFRLRDASEVFLPKIRHGYLHGVELRDEQGELVGYFVPPPLHRELILAWSRAHVSDDELEEARREPAGRPLSEIFSDLDQR